MIMRVRGFTLIEMLVVLTLMAILASAARPLLELSVQRSREHELRQALRTVRTALDAYKKAVDAGQLARAAEDSGYPPNLLALTAGVADVKSTDGKRVYFLRRLPRDPFADPALAPADSWGLRAADSPPDEARPGRDVFDIYSRSERRALDGTKYRDW